MLDNEFDRFGVPKLSVVGFPPSLETLRDLYDGFTPIPEFHRDSLEELFSRILKTYDWDAVVSEFGLPNSEVRDVIMQRLFYRSCVAFYRFYDLFLAHLVTDGFSFRTWSKVTGYYSRFYFVQAWLNLLQSSWVDLSKSLGDVPEGSRPARDDLKFFLFNTLNGVKIHNEKELRKVVAPQGVNFGGSHQIWWTLFNSSSNLESFDFIPELDFVQSFYDFNPKERNRENYSFQYLEGFPELEWFDQSSEQMAAHFMPRPRKDKDFTDMDAYFKGEEPASSYVDDFYCDDAQIFWHSLDAYLRLLRALNVPQDFITCEKLEFLLDIHIKEKFPVIAVAMSEKMRLALLG